ncbi:MAG TPA: divalent-cation tolerance protein CutA [Candidatus Acidoferrales bacterium]|nr:divalent-cation tolerance protein CutA [Candidatus Acidoferrales bacterium]
MKKSNGKRVVLVTCASLSEARRIARSVVKARLAACVNILRAPVESVYRWKGAVETAREYLLLIKTTKKSLGALEDKVKKLHSHEVPEFISLPIAEGSRTYLRWLGENVAG